MIISKTPFRISFSGGGTDFPQFYEHSEGSVLSAAIDKYMYIMVNRRFDDTLRISYSQTEIVDCVDRVRHDLVRETLRFMGIRGGLEIVSIADIPAQSGLGSSSCFTVGLLHALHGFQGRHVTAEQLAGEACHIEIDICKAPIGKQDQVIVAHGGLQHIRFQRDGQICVNPVICHPDIKKALENNLMMFYTRVTRKASWILKEQKQEIPSKTAILVGLRDCSFQMKNVLTRGENLSEFGNILHRSWQLKKQMTQNISNKQIDAYYERALQAGALGGKILGAGGGGFLLLYVEPEKQNAVRQVLSDLRELPIAFEHEGSKIIYVGA